MDEMNAVTIEIKSKRDFSPLVLNTYLPTFILTVINQLTNYFIGFELFEGKIAWFLGLHFIIVLKLDNSILNAECLTSFSDIDIKKLVYFSCG